MTYISYAAVYFVIWWIVLFAVLPFGVKTVEVVEQGHDGGAPASAHMFKKAAATTAISALVFIIGWWVLTTGIIDLTK
jgi:predicted secreted protein